MIVKGVTLISVEGQTYRVIRGSHQVLTVFREARFSEAGGDTIGTVRCFPIGEKPTLLDAVALILELHPNA